MKSMRFFAWTLLILFIIIPVASAEETESEPFIPGEWLVTNAVMMPYALMDADSSADPVSALLGRDIVDPYLFWPSDKTVVNPAPGKTITFNAKNSTSLEFTPLPEAGQDYPFLAMAATYLDVDTWNEATIEVKGRAPFKLYLEAEEVLSRTSTADSDTAVESGDITLDQGRRRILLVSVLSGADSLANWLLELSITPTSPEDAVITATTDPRHRFDITDYYLQESIVGQDLSKDGAWYAVIRGIRNGQTDKTEKWLEVWSLKDKKRVWEYRNSKGIGSVQWSPDSKTLLITVSGKDKGTDLLRFDPATLTLCEMESSLEDAMGFTWSPDGQGIYYTLYEAFEEDDKPYKVMWDMPDRWTGFRDHMSLCYMGLDGNTHLKFSEGKYTPDQWVVSPDGSKILVISGVSRVERPFMVNNFWIIDTQTGEAEKVFTFEHSSTGHPVWSPDGKYVAFDAPMNPVLGNDSPYPDNNDNQTDLWILDLTTREAENKTRDFEPAVAMGAYGVGFGGTIIWHEDGTIGFTGLYNKHMRWYIYDPVKDVMTTHDLPTPGATSLVASTDKKSTIAVFRGQQVGQYGDMYWYDWKKKKSGMLFPLAEHMKQLITFDNKVTDYDVTYWDAVEKDSVTVPGFLFYPANYDPAKKYPVVTDFYGGVFGYAEGWMWMSQVFSTRDYFVYVPTPRGAAGWGQKFADSHPNDWGVRTTRDMNTGLRHIVDNVPGADGDRCAPVSGSYGGFMTMYMLSMDHSSPDYYPYATGISDYGISNLASYWGIGWWGYLYSDMATARTYPWTDPQYYIDHSPLFFADNVTAPLLLLHGDGDVNVPVGESDQMYTALKVLGKEVEFIRFPGEDHGMASTRAKYLTSKRIHIEWFDRFLKDRPEAWDSRMENEFQR